MNNLYQLIKDDGNMSLEILSGYDRTTTYYEPVVIEGVQYDSLLDYLLSATKS